MDRNTDLRNMDAPAPGSGKSADDTMLKATATGQTAAEAATNTLQEYTTPAQPKGGLGGRASH